MSVTADDINRIIQAEIAKLNMPAPAAAIPAPAPAAPPSPAATGMKQISPYLSVPEEVISPPPANWRELSPNQQIQAGMGQMGPPITADTIASAGSMNGPGGPTPVTVKERDWRTMSPSEQMEYGLRQEAGRK